MVLIVCFKLHAQAFPSIGTKFKLQKVQVPFTWEERLWGVWARQELCRGGVLGRFF